MLVPPARAVKPVLSASRPLNKRTIPLVPVVTVGAPDTKMLPPKASPTARFLPAFKVTAVVPVFVVAMLCANVMFPDVDSKSTVPED